MRFLPILLCFYAVSAAGGIAVKVGVNFDDTVSTLYRDGEKPQGGACLSGFTCAAMGTAPLCDVDAADADTADIAVISENDEEGGCAVYKEATTDQDIHVELEFNSLVAGNAGNFTSILAFIHEGTATTDTIGMHSSWQALGPGTRICKFDGGGVNESGQFGGTGTLPERYILQYDDSEDELRCGYGSDGTAWTSIGDPVTVTLSFPLKYGIIATSYDPVLSSTLRADHVVADGTIETITPAPGDTSETADYVDPLDGVTLLGGRNPVAVANTAALDAALPGTCGDTITLGNATYTGNKTLSTVCPTNNPIIITGSGDFNEIITGRWTTTGNQYIIKNLQLSGTDAGFTCRGTNNHVLANEFVGTNGNAVQLEVAASPGQQCEIAYNKFYDPGACPGSGFNQAIKMNTGGNGQFNTVQQNTWIHHNLFLNWNQTNCFQADVIELGESAYDWVQVSGANAYIDSNLFDNFLNNTFSGVMDLKIGGNIVRRNTVINSGSASTISHRLGIASTYDANWIATGRLQTRNPDTIAVCNRIRGSKLYVMAGTEPPLTENNGQPAALNNHIAGNDGPLEVGYQPNGTYVEEAEGTLIEDHTGVITLSHELTTTNNFDQAATYDCTPAVELQTNQVGPAAITNEPAAYKDPRGL